MDKRFLAILTAIVVIFIGIFAVTQGSNNKSGNNSGGNSSKATNHIMGKGASGVTLLEYGDYQCPVCQRYYQPLKDSVAKYENDIKFQFRNLPLVQIHPNAFAGARAAEAAAIQNKFWEMHDTLYEPINYQDWISSKTPTTLFNRYAEQLGLNVEQFKKDYASEKVNDAINADLAEFDKTGQDQSTPTIFISGQKVDLALLVDSSTGLPTVEKISKVIEDAIAKQKQ